MAWQLYQGDALEILKQMEDESIHCCVTSPPYWGLRDYGVDGQLGLESTPEEYVANMVEVFREVKRVLRKDGTLWLNLGDTYNGTKIGNTETKKNPRVVSDSFIKKSAPNVKVKDLIGIPWMVAFALRADGWWLRSDIIWKKGNPMPESVTDRPTKAHEYIFLLTKSERYYYDNEAIKEDAVNGDPAQPRGSTATLSSRAPQINSGRRKQDEIGKRTYEGFNGRYQPLNKRNKRSVWSINTKPFSESHFAVFPPEIPEICIKAGTSERGCCSKCGSPWERVVERKRLKRNEFAPSDPRYRPNVYQGAYGDINGKGDAGYVETSTIGWQPTCTCGINETVPCTVLDPFAGAGTTLWVAEQLGVNSIGIELNPEYCEIIRHRMNSLGRLFSEEAKL